MNTMQDYFDALQRLEERSERITKDAVSREAGRGAGSIKKSRPEFAELIAKINEAAARVNAGEVENDSLAELRVKLRESKRTINLGLSREISLLRELRKVKMELSEIRGGNIVPISTARKSKGIDL